MVDPHEPQTLKQHGRRTVSTVSAPPGLFQCLVVSAVKVRRDRLATSAVEGGWETIKFTDPREAASYAQRRGIRLCIVDLEGIAGSRLSAMQELAIALAAVKDVLLIVCGHEGRLQEEIWARQLGIWLYLPGVTEDSDVGFLCGEAKDLTARMTDVKRIVNSHGSESRETE